MIKSGTVAPKCFKGVYLGQILLQIVCPGHIFSPTTFKWSPRSLIIGCIRILSLVELLNVMDFGKVVENELSCLFTTRTIMVQLVLTGYLLFSSIYSDYSVGI